jgi:dihydroneopterin aldolase
MTILIEGLELEAFIGVYAHEQEQRQTIRVDLEAEVEEESSVTTDNLTETLDYHHLVRQIRERLEKERYQLVERLAGEIAEVALKSPLVNEVTVEVRKPQALQEAMAVGVRLKRTR